MILNTGGTARGRTSADARKSPDNTLRDQAPSAHCRSCVRRCLAVFGPGCRLPQGHCRARTSDRFGPPGSQLRVFQLSCVSGQCFELVLSSCAQGVLWYLPILTCSIGHINVASLQKDLAIVGMQNRWPAPRPQALRASVAGGSVPGISRVPRARLHDVAASPLSEPSTMRTSPLQNRPGSLAHQQEHAPFGTKPGTYQPSSLNDQPQSLECAKRTIALVLHSANGV